MTQKKSSFYKFTKRKEAWLGHNLYLRGGGWGEVLLYMNFDENIESIAHSQFLIHLFLNCLLLNQTHKKK